MRDYPACRLHILKPVLLFAALLIFQIAATTSARAATYYVDSAGGSDANSGTTIGAPWQTIAKVNASAFSAGDNILFKAGGAWYEELYVPSSGSAGNPITFGAYGAGAAPAISGLSPMTAFAADTSTLFYSNFDTETSAFTNEWTGVVGPGYFSLSTTTTKNSSTSLQVSTLVTTSTNPDIYKTLNSASTNYTLGFWINAAATTSNYWGIMIGNTASHNAAEVAFGVSGSNVTAKVVGWNGANTATSSAYFTVGAPGTWHYLQMNVIASSSGSVQLLIDGTSTVTLSGIANSTSGLPYQLSIVAGNTAGGLYYYDGVSFTDNTYAPLANVWTERSNSQPYFAFVNGALGTYVSSTAQLAAPGQWTWGGANNNLAVYAGSDPSGTVLAGQRTAAINLNHQSYITIDGITVGGANGSTNLNAQYNQQGGAIYIPYDGGASSTDVTIQNVSTTLSQGFDIAANGVNNLNINNNLLGGTLGTGAGTGDAITVRGYVTYATSTGWTGPLATNITIASNTVSGTFPRQGISLVGVNGATIANNTITYAYSGGYGGGAAIDIEPNTNQGDLNVTVSGNAITLSSAVSTNVNSGINLQGSNANASSTNVTVSGNTIAVGNNGNVGIRVATYSGTNLITSNTVSGLVNGSGVYHTNGPATISGNSIAAGSAASSTGIYVTNNDTTGANTSSTIINNKITGVYIGVGILPLATSSVTNAIITGNSIASYAGSIAGGIEVERKGSAAAVYATSTYNIVNGFAYGALNAFSTTTAVYYNNLFAGFTLDGVFAEITSTVAYSNNIMFYSGASPIAMIRQLSGGAISGSNNLYYHPSSTVFWATSTTTTSTLSGWKALWGMDASSLDADPKFANPSTPDFTLQASSPAIDAGINLGDAYASGLSPSSAWPSGVVTVSQNANGTGWEIGPYVYTSATSTGSATTSSAPQSLSATAGNAQVSLSWSAPASDGGSALTQYLIYGRITGSSTFDLYATTSASLTGGVASGLANGQSYDFEIVAQNGIGTSTPSNMISATPSAPAVIVSGGGGGGGGSGYFPQTVTPAQASGSDPFAAQRILLANLQLQLLKLLQLAAAQGIAIPSAAQQTAGASPASTSASGVTSTAALPTGAIVFTRNLSVGSWGWEVWNLQRYLNTHGFPVAATGIGSLGDEAYRFGNATKAALARFQVAHGIAPAAGTFGPVTRAYINSHP